MSMIKMHLLCWLLTGTQPASAIAGWPDAPGYKEIGPNRGNRQTVVRGALEPTSGCNKLFPKWIATKYSENMLEDMKADPVTYLRNYPSASKWPVIGICVWWDTKMEHIPNSFVFKCWDMFYWHRSGFVVYPLPEGEVVVSEAYTIVCPDGTVAVKIPTRFPMLDYPHDMGLMCHCQAVDSVSVEVRAKATACVQADPKRVGTVVGSVSDTTDASTSMSLVLKKVRVPESKRIKHDHEASFTPYIMYETGSNRGTWQLCATNGNDHDVEIEVGVVDESGW